MAKGKMVDVTRDEKGIDATTQLPTDDKSGKANRAGRSQRRSKGRPGKKYAQQKRSAGNATLEKMTYDSPMSKSSIVFPSDSAAMQSFGNFITTPGQDNFLSDFNHIQTTVDGIRTRTFTASDLASRTCNAMCIDFDTYFGAVESSKSSWITQPLQMAAANLKQYVDTSFGTRTDYDAQDLMLYLMSLTDIFTSIAEAKRNLRLVYTYIVNQYPQYVPQGLFSLLQISDDQHNYANGEGLLYTAKHLRELIDELNQYIIMFNRLPIPPELLVYGYNDDLFDCVFMDSDDFQTAQLYVFRKFGVWSYNENSSDPTVGAMLSYWHDVTPVRSMQEMINGIGTRIAAISALRTSSTAMLQNLFNAYGSRDTVTIPTVDINALEPLSFRCDPNVLTMIENAVICGPSQVTITDITVNHLRSEIHGSVMTPVSSAEGGITAQAAMSVNLPLQFHKPFADVTTDDVGWALRMHPSFVRAEVFVEHGEVDICYTANGYTGFALCRQIRVGCLSNDGHLYTYNIPTRGIEVPPTASIGNSDFRMWVNSLNAYADFNASPISITYTATVNSDTGRLDEVKVENYLARRDVEATYRLEDLAMHWVYLSQTLWGANINRNVTGSRTRT